MNSSPERGSFQREKLVERGEAGETSAEHVQEMLEFYTSMDKLQAEREAKPEWKENNLEYDLRSTKWICDKAKEREEYAQNLYAAMCNNDFQKLDTWPLLKGQVYSCSWRYAGGIVADMVERGDYIDWYCSGIGGQNDEDYLATLTEEQVAKIRWYDEHFVSESVVTDEVREDLLKLGWKVIEDKNDDNI